MSTILSATKDVKMRKQTMLPSYRYGAKNVNATTIIASNLCDEQPNFCRCCFDYPYRRHASHNRQSRTYNVLRSAIFNRSDRKTYQYDGE